MQNKKLVIGNDHAAVPMKFEIKKFLEEELKYEVINVGVDKAERCDYPDYAYAACQKVLNGEAELGILICGTGVGMSIAANKIKGIRACACSETYSAKLSRQHNNTNVLCLGARTIGPETAKEIVKAFLSGSFEGGRHADRMEKVRKIEDGTYEAK